MKKEKNKNIWITSDPHIGHGNIMKYCSRTDLMTTKDKERFLEVKDDTGNNYRNFKLSFDSIKKMNELLIKNINDLVMPDDELWILGDFIFCKDKETVWYYRNQINCKTVKLIWGNHDDRYLLKYAHENNGPMPFQGYYESGLFFQTDKGLMSEDEICLEFSGKNPYKNSNKFYLSHYPHAVWNGHHKGVIMLHGHCHSTLEEWKKQHMPNASCFDMGVDEHGYSPVHVDDILSWKKIDKHDIDHHSPKMKIVRDNSGNH